MRFGGRFLGRERKGAIGDPLSFKHQVSPREFKGAASTPEVLQSKDQKYGTNIHAVIEFSRHEVPGKNPDGSSADFLEPEGQQKAADKGETISEQYVKDYSSQKLRAQETGVLGLQNVAETVEVINQRLEGKQGVVKGQKPENEFIMRLRPELDAIPGFTKFMNHAECKKYVAEEMAENPSAGKLDLVIQYYLDRPELAEKVGVTTPGEAAEEMAFAAEREIKMTDRMKSGSEVRLRNFSHGPKLEPFLQKVIIFENGQHGFKNLDEIGGSFGPGESFQFNVNKDAQGRTEVTITLNKSRNKSTREQEIVARLEQINNQLKTAHGQKAEELEKEGEALEKEIRTVSQQQEYKLDMDIVKELADKYRLRLKKQRIPKVKEQIAEIRKQLEAVNQDLAKASGSRHDKLEQEGITLENEVRGMEDELRELETEAAPGKILEFKNESEDADHHVPQSLAARNAIKIIFL